MHFPNSKLFKIIEVKLEIIFYDIQVEKGKIIIKIMRKSDFCNYIWVNFTETVLKFVRHWNSLQSFQVNEIKHKQ